MSGARVDDHGTIHRSRNHGLARAGRVVRRVHTFDIAIRDDGRSGGVLRDAHPRIRANRPVTMTPETRGGERGPGGASLAPSHRGVPRGVRCSPPRRPGDGTGGQPDRMLRLLHTADVHLGARHADLGEQAAAQRERQFAAFRATVDLAIAEQVDVVPRRRRPVRLEHPAAPLGRARRRRAPRASPRRDPDRDHPGHPRRLRPLVALPRPRPGGACRAQGRTTIWSPS